MTTSRAANLEILEIARENGWDHRVNVTTLDFFFDRGDDRLAVRFSRKGAVIFAKYNSHGTSALWDRRSTEIKKDRRKAVLDILTR